MAKLVPGRVIGATLAKKKDDWLLICTGWLFAGTDTVAVASSYCYGRKAGE